MTLEIKELKELIQLIEIHNECIKNGFVYEFETSSDNERLNYLMTKLNIYSIDSKSIVFNND